MLVCLRYINRVEQRKREGERERERERERGERGRERDEREHRKTIKNLYVTRDQAINRETRKHQDGQTVCTGIEPTL